MQIFPQRGKRKTHRYRWVARNKYLPIVQPLAPCISRLLCGQRGCPLRTLYGKTILALFCSCVNGKCQSLQKFYLHLPFDQAKNLAQMGEVNLVCNSYFVGFLQSCLQAQNAMTVESLHKHKQKVENCAQYRSYNKHPN